MRQYDIDDIIEKGGKIINGYCLKAGALSIIPIVGSISIPLFVKEMISDINDMVEIKPNKELIERFSSLFMASILVSPMASIPITGIAAGLGSIGYCGSEYLTAVAIAAKKANKLQDELENILIDVLKSGEYKKYKLGDL